MGTRDLVGFIISGRRRAIYCHNDSYPEWLGKLIIDFILSLKPEEYDLMAAKLRDNVKWSPEHSEAKVSILRDVWRGRELEIKDEVNFLQNITSCEWPYFIDFENRKLEVWRTGEIFDMVTFPILIEIRGDYVKILEEKCEETWEARRELLSEARQARTAARLRERYGEGATMADD